MKNIFLPALAGLLMSAAAQAQSTADSIEAKYKLLPMPDSMTREKAFPILGTYQLNGPVAGSSSTTTTYTNSNSGTSGNTMNGGTITVTMDSSNTGIVWIDGLPEGRMKAYLKKSPATYRIVPQTTSTGRSVPEGVMVYTPENNILNIEVGSPYNEADPSSVFMATNGSVSGDASSSSADVNVPASGKMKVKTKTATSKTKNRVMYYTASKSLTNSSSNAAQQ